MNSIVQILVLLAVVLMQLGLSPGGALPPTDSQAPATRPPRPVPRRDPTAASKVFNDQRAAPAKTILPGALLRARRQVEERIRNGVIPVVPHGNPRSGSAAPSSLAAASAVTESRWSLIGPESIAQGVGGEARYPIAGRVSAVAIEGARPRAYIGPIVRCRVTP